MRPRSETIGTLGRAPARASTPPPVPLPPRPPDAGGLGGVVRRWIRSAVFDNVGLKFLSIVLAVTVFLLVNTDRDREIAARVGVSYMLPEDKVLVSKRLDEVRITVKGSWRRLRKFDEREVDRINLDLRRASSGETSITTEMVHLPSGLTVTSINPRSVHVAFDRRVEKIVEVSPVVTGRPQHGYVVAEAKPAPATVKLRGAEGTLAVLTSVRTREVSLEGHTDSFDAATDLMPPDGVDVVGNPTITLQIHIDEELVTRKLPGQTVVVGGDGDAARWRIVPAQVDITLTGALLAVEKARGSLVPVARLAPDGKPREVEVTIDGLPPGIGVKISPEHVKLVPVKPAGPAPPRAP